MDLLLRNVLDFLFLDYNIGFNMYNNGLLKQI